MIEKCWEGIKEYTKYGSKIKKGIIVNVGHRTTEDEYGRQ
jgi:hypothetical protein